jgi:hypothetical protein
VISRWGLHKMIRSNSLAYLALGIAGSIDLDGKAFGFGGEGQS